MTLAYLALAWFAGIALAKTLPLPWQVLPLLGLAALLGLLLWRDDAHAPGHVRLGALCTLAAALGAGRFLLAVPHFDETALASYNDAGWVSLKGVVVGEPDERERSIDLRVQVERLTLRDGRELEVQGLALVKAARYPERHYGDRVRVEGVLEAPPVFEEFSYRDYLARQGIHSLVRRSKVTLLGENRANPLFRQLLAFKRYAQATIAAMLPEPQAALLTGILLGVERGIPADVMDDFAATGTAHIIAISGFNISILSGVFAGLAQRLFDRRRATWAAIGGVTVYTILVGASAPVVRAAVMGILYLLARYLGRAAFAPVSLAAAGIVMTAANPHMLWDVGFLLSCAATVGLLLYARPLERLFEQVLDRVTSSGWLHQLLGLVSGVLAATLAAQVTVTPIALYYFGRLSLVSLISNLLVLPAQSAVMVFGGLATVLGLVVRPLGQLVGWVAWVFLTYTIKVVQLTAQVPFASVRVQTDAWMMLAYYALLGALTWWVAQPGERRTALWAKLRSALSARLETKVIGGAAAILAVLAFFAWRALPDGRLHVVFLDVGEGDAIFIQTPSGRQVLIDGGPSETVLLSQLGRQMPFWDRTLDVVLLTHPDDDHITGLMTVLERYQVDKMIFREVGCATDVCEHWRLLLEAEGGQVFEGETGLRLTLDNADASRPVEMELLHPGPELIAGTKAEFNDNSIVTRLTYGRVSVLLPGDIEAEAEHRLVDRRAALGSTVLKAAHHGSCSSTIEEFLAAVDPEVVVISVGADNDFGHPCAGVLKRLEDLAVYRTDEQGTVEVITDGSRVWVETER